MDEKSPVSGPFQLRLPEGMREKLKARAAANRRSMNSEILVCLEKAVGSEANEDAA
ncbi:Arc family DNA-binding protein [Agrobacterium tumefaciens]|uniref:Arc family DNA-binding protein n=1 Tax=Agrobacterium tumefaciens TaxID=358 RepID=UPI000459A786|nr:Arc family DNA-binding protein [Agrobacterium tumefaciens]CDN92506.1 Mnt [Agrobacterium tumefaciens]